MPAVPHLDLDGVEPVLDRHCALAVASRHHRHSEPQEAIKKSMCGWIVSPRRRKRPRCCAHSDSRMENPSTDPTLRFKPPFQMDSELSTSRLTHVCKTK